ncbi:imidazoleglycerol-phosphate dehydratase HisB [Formicincola oecophyllae]|uniref:Imidazoleglycerol-phosphate dehydratase n=2 Tax=Formicincola oecophyllae TaxID=2558361 RepID=A0A4Y6UCV4_9PROT|nr:imidazoleglycerol-phosphate dehydratase HisB [Formicincola oecophyllae]
MRRPQPQASHSHGPSPKGRAKRSAENHGQPGGRTAKLTRKTGETGIFVQIDLDGAGQVRADTGIGFFDHMLAALGRHGGLDLSIVVSGDLHVDDHHTIEDVGIALGEAFYEAIGDKAGIERFGSALVPLDEALCETVIDVSGRPFIAWNVRFEREYVGRMSTEMVEEFFRAFVMSARVTAHINLKAGHNGHHIAEAVFKSFARALRMAVAPDPRQDGVVPSTKGVL